MPRKNRFVPLSRRTSLALGAAMLIVALGGSFAWSTGTLPLFETLGSSANLDLTRTTARYAQDEQAVLQAFQHRRYGSFAAGVTVGVDGALNTRAVALADLDGDGDLDAVTVAGDTSPALYLNNGTEAPFEGVAALYFGTPGAETSVATADVDGDGNVDIVTGNDGSPNRLYLNNGTANPFQGVSGSDVGADNDNTYDIVLADMNGDGRLDAVAGNSDATSKVYFNNGTAAPFNGVAGADIGADTLSTRVVLAVADCDGDGDLDVAAADQVSALRLTLNNGTATPFAGAISTNIGNDATFTNDLAAGDVDGDGDIDLVAAREGADRLYLNNGTTNPFNGVTGVNVGNEADYTWGLALFDFDADGDLDLVTQTHIGETNKVFRNNGTAAPFTGVAGMAIGGANAYGWNGRLAMGDVDGDGDTDVLAAMEQARRLYLNETSVNPFAGTAAATGTPSGTTRSMAAGDVDGDGDLDVVVGNSSSKYLYLNNGTATPFNGVAAVSIGLDSDATYAIGLADIDGDGALDVVAGHWGVMNKWYRNDGDASPFSSAGMAIGTDADDTVDLALTDVDSDGDSDVVVANQSAGAKLYLNDGDANPFSSVTTGLALGAYAYTNGIETGDLDGDGDIDAVVAQAYDIAVYLNNGTADPFNGVTAEVFVSGLSQLWSLELADLTGDGAPDLVAGAYGEVPVRLFLNNGTANPFAGVTGTDLGDGVQIGAYPPVSYAIAAADVDGDGDRDIAIGSASTAGGYVNQLYLNNGTADPFAGVNARSIASDAAQTTTLALGDFDGDGDIDALAGNYGSPGKLYLNQGTPTPLHPLVTSQFSADAMSSRDLAVADMDGDGDLDLVAGTFNNPNRLYLNNGTAEPFVAVAGSDIGADAYATMAIALGDLDGDGDIDVAAGNQNNSGNHSRIYLNNGTADPFSGVAGTNLASSSNYPAGALAAGDVDGDGDLDLALGFSDGSARYIYLYQNNGAAAFTPALLGTDQVKTNDIVFADVDGDGDLDAVVATLGATNKLFVNDGSATPFTTAAVSIGADVENTYAIGVADVDNDGDLDVVAGNAGTSSKLYLNNGTATPFNGVSGTAISADVRNTFGIALVDVDHDGDVDVVTGNQAAAPRLYLNDGDSAPFSSGPGSDLGTGSEATNDIIAADFDRDGQLEFVAANGGMGETDKLYRRVLLYQTAAQTARSVTLTTAPASTSFYFDAAVSLPRNTAVDFSLSNDDGATWKAVRPGATVTFAAPGTQVVWQAKFRSLSARYTPAITSVTIINRDPGADADGDQLSDFDEHSAGTDPRDSDSDNDALPDGWEVAINTNPLAADATADPDSDSLDNLAEYNAGTDPHDNDTDGDTLPDGWEANNGTNALVADAAADGDGDGLDNAGEFAAGSDPQDADSDDDTLPDGWEAANGTNPTVTDGTGDSDSDGLTNAQEFALGTDPQAGDSDADGMPDKWENDYALDPTTSSATVDTDSDGLNDASEYAAGTFPGDTDSDDDLIPDGAEVTLGLDPLLDDAAADPDSDGLSNYAEWTLMTNPHAADSDSDGMPDKWENDHGLNPLTTDDGPTDADADGLSNLHEYQHGADPQDADTDDDGMQDGWESDHALNLVSNDAAADADNDGLSNLEENQAMTDPQDADSDGDGLKDGVEVEHGLDPLDAKDAGADSDGDGVSNADEIAAGTDVNVADQPEAPGDDTQPTDITPVEPKASRDNQGGCSTAGADGAAAWLPIIVALLAFRLRRR